MESRPVQVTFSEALRLKIGCLDFGGPAGQIALMHRILVDEKKWVEESRYLHALNFCMLLPEFEAFATYVGWPRTARAAGSPPESCSCCRARWSCSL